MRIIRSAALLCTLYAAACAADSLAELDPHLEVTAALDFGSVGLNGMRPLFVQIDNVGIGRAEVERLELAADPDSDLAIAATSVPTPAALDRGDRMEVTVRFSPRVLGEQRAVLTVVGSDGPHQTALVGVGVLANGAIEGRVCAGIYWVAGARVYIVLDSGAVLETVTAADGSYRLTDVPNGSYLVQVEKGSFTSTTSVQVAGDTVVIADGSQCLGNVSLAVVTGDWDRMEWVLDRLGFPAVQTFDTAAPADPSQAGAPNTVDLINGCRMQNLPPWDSSHPWVPCEHSFWVDSFLTNLDWMRAYDIIFVDCGAKMDPLWNGPNGALAIANLQAYVAGGGSLYASDWAYDLIRVAFPNRLDFLGDDRVGGDAKLGMIFNWTAFDVVDTGLATALGKTQIMSSMPNYWALLQPVDQQLPDVQVMVKGDVGYWQCDQCSGVIAADNTPMVVTFTDGQGRVVFTSLHVEEKTDRPGDWESNNSQDLQAAIKFMAFEL